MISQKATPEIDMQFALTGISVGSPIEVRLESKPFGMVRLRMWECLGPALGALREASAQLPTRVPRSVQPVPREASLRLHTRSRRRARVPVRSRDSA